MKNIMLAAIIFCLLITCAYSNDTGNEFYEANRYYGAGDYGKAITVYEKILEKGLKSGNLYYDLGNAYLKNGNIGNAILNYERARYFMPRDGALLSNYNYALSLMKQRGVKGKEHFIIKHINRFFSLLSLRETALVFNGSYYCFAILLVLSFFIKRFRFLTRLVAFLMVCVMVLSILPYRNKLGEAEKGAIIVSPIADAKFEPGGGEGASHFPLYEGMEVILIRTQKDWSKVKRPDGKIGWVEASSVESIW